MRPGERSDWALDAFGEHVEVLRDRISAGLAAAHMRARASHDAARSRKLRVYGITLWECQHEEMVSAVAPIDGATVAKFGAYELPVLATKVLFPLRYADRSGVPVEDACLPVPVSQQRERLFGAHAPEMEHPQPYLDESWAELEPSRDHDVFPQLGEDAELIVIAYACSLEAGIMNIEWGHAKHVGDGELLWGEHTPLPLISAGVAGAVSPGNGQTATGYGLVVPRFDATEEPGLALGLRHPGDKTLGVPPQTERHLNEPHTQNNDQD